MMDCGNAGNSHACRSLRSERLADSPNSEIRVKPTSCYTPHPQIPRHHYLFAAQRGAVSAVELLGVIDTLRHAPQTGPFS